MGLYIIIVASLLLMLSVTTVLAEEFQVILNADGGVDYDLEKDTVTAHNNVRLTRGDLLIKADQVVYNEKSGIVEASGNVSYQSGETEYRTDFLTYDMMNKTGNSGQFTATIPGEPRNFQLKGRTLKLSETTSELTKVVITRCPKAHPDYQLAAARVNITGRRVQLKHVVVKVMGIPVFYLPVLIFYTNLGLPQLAPDYNHDYQAWQMKCKWLVDAKDKHKWNFIGDIATCGDANVGFELENDKAYSNNKAALVYYYCHDSLQLTDSYTCEGKHYAATLDGAKKFSDDHEEQLGLELKQKYWQSPGGAWQVGALARYVKARDDRDEKYGGAYSGFRLNYKPINNVTLSWLKIKSYSGDDYRDLMEDYRIGTNLLYEVGIPLTAKYSFGMNGAYNISGSRWVHEKYTLTMADCCFDPYLGYDRTEHSWSGGFKFNF